MLKGDEEEKEEGINHIKKKASEESNVWLIMIYCIVREKKKVK